MKHRLFIVTLLIFLFASGLAGATDQSDFQAKTTKNLIDMCTTPTDDPMYTPAINFCHGYLVGAFHYYKVISSGPKGPRLVCMPEPPPSRNDVIGMFIQWAQDHPKYWNDPPVEAEFRFLNEKWPCK